VTLNFTDISYGLTNKNYTLSVFFLFLDGISLAAPAIPCIRSGLLQKLRILKRSAYPNLTPRTKDSLNLGGSKLKLEIFRKFVYLQLFLRSLLLKCALQLKIALKPPILEF